MIIYGTLCFLVKDNKILLLKKSKELFGGGKWNAPGGKIRDGETPEEGAKREFFEETGMEAKYLEKIGTLNFFPRNIRNKPEWVVYVFVAESASGSMKRESREGVLKWFDLESVPFEEMWEDDKYWYPYLLERKKFKANFFFSGAFEKLEDHELEVL